MEDFICTTNIFQPLIDIHIEVLSEKMSFEMIALITTPKTCFLCRNSLYSRNFHIKIQTAQIYSIFGYSEVPNISFFF